MATIEQNLSEIRSAVYGEDVRNSIANAIEVINNENETLRSSVSASVQNTLENFQPYELVETLPATGKSNKIYALLDLDYIDSDSKSSEASEWSSLQTAPYIQASITPGCYVNDDANAVKPVMARYYLVNAQVTCILGGHSYNQTLKSLAFENRELTATSYIGQSITSIVTAITKGLFQQSNDIPSNINSLANVSLILAFKEYIYDSDDRLWKYNKNKTVTLTNIKATRKTSTLFEFNISKVNDDIRLNAIVFMQKSDWSFSQDIGWISVYYDGYRIDLRTTDYEAIGKLCKTANDQYGYDTASHSTGHVISQKSSAGVAFYGPGTSIGAVGGEPVKWDIAIPSTSTATMYIWSESLQGFIRLTSGS